MDEKLVMDIANGVNGMYKKGMEVGKKLAEKEIEKLEDELCDLQKKLDSAEDCLRGCRCSE